MVVNVYYRLIVLQQHVLVEFVYHPLTFQEVIAVIVLIVYLEYVKQIYASLLVMLKVQEITLMDVNAL